jgi:hypothetical protein
MAPSANSLTDIPVLPRVLRFIVRASFDSDLPMVQWHHGGHRKR